MGDFGVDCSILGLKEARLESKGLGGVWLVKEVLNRHLERFRNFVEMLEIEVLAITAVFAVGEKRHRFDPDIKSKLELRDPSLLTQDSDFA